MREAIGQTFIVNLIIIFVIIFLVLFAGSINYTKAYKVKNRIISIIEENNGYTLEAQKQINTFLGETGYRISNKGCSNNDYHYKKDAYSIGSNHNTNWKAVSTNSDYKYCIEEVTTKNGDIEQKFYGVTAYMYFEIPIISSLLELPVYGETKTMGILGN